MADKNALDIKLPVSTNTTGGMPPSVGSIRLDENGVAWIAQTTTKVVEIVLDYACLHLTPEQIQEEHPHLTLAQILAALKYYAEHKEEIDADIERRDRYIEEMKAKSVPRATRRELEERLRRQGAETPD